jgi:uncharacterized protein (TIGR00369 family)
VGSERPAGAGAASAMRRRVVEWTDPAVYASAAAMSGLELLRAILRGTLPRPPVAELLGMRGVEVERGRVVFEMEVGEHHYSPLNIVHGGVTATLLDTAMGCAVASTLEAGVTYTTTDLHVRYVRPLTVANGLLRAVGTMVHAGNRLVTAEGKVTDAAGKLIAHADTACLILTPAK